MPVSGEVAIVGAGVTPFGVLHEKSYLDLIADSAAAATADAGIALGLVEAAWLGPLGGELVAEEEEDVWGLRHQRGYDDGCVPR